MIKKRVFKGNNYSALWYDGKTMRLAIDPQKPITELEYPEFLDVKITGKCEGKCPWCYMDSKETDSHYDNVPQKIKEFFGPMSDNERPFQVAIGGGEPTSHPDFVECLKAFKELNIEPNYTTNGMHLTDDIIKATQKYCGGVAVSCHPHLKDWWMVAANLLANAGVKLNFHIIISDKESIDYFKEIYDYWKDLVDYFVLLPYGSQGRAEHKDIDFKYLCSKLPEDQSQIAFGANFYPYLMEGDHNVKVSLYEPEIMSKFLDMSDMSIHKSSFSLNV